MNPWLLFVLAAPSVWVVVAWLLAVEIGRVIKKRDEHG